MSDKDTSNNHIVKVLTLKTGNADSRVLCVLTNAYNYDTMLAMVSNTLLGYNYTWESITLEPSMASDDLHGLESYTVLNDGVVIGELTDYIVGSWDDEWGNMHQVFDTAHLV